MQLTIDDKEKLWPREYTSKEGGNFKLWLGKSVTRTQLVKLIDKKPANSVLVHITNFNIHSLIFETAAAGHGNYARWDCLNGWTTTIEEAKKKWPKGLHGQKPLIKP